MKRNMILRLTVLVLRPFLLMILLSEAVLGQNYPNKPIRLVVPFVPGGSSDIVARIISPKLSESLRQPIVIDNKGGAGGNIGAEIVAKSPSDGYTLCMATSSTFVINPSLYRKVAFDTEKNFTPITLIAYSPNLLVVNPSLPVKSVKDLIALAKSKPGALNFASSGAGGTTHLAGVLFNMMADVNMVHIPYKGAGPAATELIGGHVQVMFSTMATVLSHVKAGKLRALGVGGTQRSAALPDVPTISESGLPGFDVSTWHGMSAPAGISKAIINKLHAEIVKVVRMPEMVEQLDKVGAESYGGTPEHFRDQISQDIKKWSKVIAATGARMD